MLTDDWREFNAALDHSLHHGASGGGPDPECRWCSDDPTGETDG